ncbi:hypothetical protein [Clostridium diolis]|uniref:hypothetical protein n=1 Tax=Clostridium diolis TaxID=223919 RepID=UPI000B3FEAC8|nr:hypothetical protein [Clostridium diolis]
MCSLDTHRVSDYYQITDLDLCLTNSHQIIDAHNDDLKCSLLEDEILDKCQGCSLKCICDRIDQVIEDYVEKTTEIVNDFSFE